MPMTPTRPDIPEPVKRQVRQRCGFGCIICGVPVYHYDHVEEYAQVQKHEVDNLVLLCPNHHQDKTSNRLPRRTVERAAMHPRNLAHPRSSPYHFFLAGEQTNLWIGGNLFAFRFSDLLPNSFDAIRIFGKTVVGIRNEDGNLLLDLSMSDRHGNLILEVDGGELSVATGVWDYRIEGSTVEIRSGMAQVELVFTFLEDGIRIDRGFFSVGPAAVVVTPQHYVILPNQITMSGNRFYQCRVGVNIA